MAPWSFAVVLCMLHLGKDERSREALLLLAGEEEKEGKWKKEGRKKQKRGRKKVHSSIRLDCTAPTTPVAGATPILSLIRTN